MTSWYVMWLFIYFFICFVRISLVFFIYSKYLFYLGHKKTNVYEFALCWKCVHLLSTYTLHINVFIKVFSDFVIILNTITSLIHEIIRSNCVDTIHYKFRNYNLVVPIIYDLLHSQTVYISAIFFLLFMRINLFIWFLITSLVGHRMTNKQNLIHKPYKLPSIKYKS